MELRQQGANKIINLETTMWTVEKKEEKLEIALRMNTKNIFLSEIIKNQNTCPIKKQQWKHFLNNRVCWMSVWFNFSTIDTT